MNTTITHVAMDTHKKQHQVAWLHPDTGEIQEFTVANTAREIERMVKKIRKQAPGEIHVCYEAGVCGFVLQRLLEKLGCVCQVIAPSLVPTKPGDRVKTDRRDAKKLLGLFAAGQLTQVHPPEASQEADRELTRCRECAEMDRKRARQRLNSLLVRHGYIYSEGSLWTGKHGVWLGGLVFDQPRVRTVFEEYRSELVENYSAGTRQKLLIAQALAVEPELLLLDEPLVSIDPLVGRKFKLYLKEIAGRGTAVLFATHILTLAQEVCQRIGVIVDGRIIVQGELGELMSLAGQVSLEEFYFQTVLRHEKPAEA